MVRGGGSFLIKFSLYLLNCYILSIFGSKQSYSSRINEAITQYDDKIVLLKEELEERENFIEKKYLIIVIDT